MTGRRRRRVRRRNVVLGRPNGYAQQWGIDEPTISLSPAGSDDQRMTPWNDDGRRRRLQRGCQANSRPPALTFKHLGRQRARARSKVSRRATPWTYRNAKSQPNRAAIGNASKSPPGCEASIKRERSTTRQQVGRQPADPGREYAPVPFRRGEPEPRVNSRSA